MTVAGVLLTGGSSRRMGRDKATMVVRGEQLATRTARVLSAVCDPVVEVGRGVTELKCVREYPPGSGPLAALVAGADELAVDEVLLLACDYPFIDEPVLRLLADWRAWADRHPRCRRPSAIRVRALRPRVVRRRAGGVEDRTALPFDRGRCRS